MKGRRKTTSSFVRHVRIPILASLRNQPSDAFMEAKKDVQGRLLRCKALIYKIMIFHNEALLINSLCGVIKSKVESM